MTILTEAFPASTTIEPIPAPQPGSASGNVTSIIEPCCSLQIDEPLEEGCVIYPLEDQNLNRYHIKYSRLTNDLKDYPKPRLGIKTPDALNLANPREIIKNWEILDSNQQHYIRTSIKSCKYHNGYCRAATLSQMGILAFSQPSFLQNLSYCGMGGKRCKNRHWCPRCAYNHATSLWKTFLPNYQKGSFWFVTLSITGSIPFTHLNATDLRIYWAMIRECLLQYCKAHKQTIYGFYSSNEVSVRQFLPTVICPHIHAVVDAADLDETFVEELQALINSLMASQGIDNDITSSVKIRQINTVESLKSALKYLVKPINPIPAYKLAWDGQIETGNRISWELNNQVRDFVNGVSYVSYYPTRLRCLQGYGSLNSGATNFIGVPKARQNDYWNEVKAISLADDDWNE